MMKEIVLKRDKTLYNGGMATIRDKGYVSSVWLSRHAPLKQYTTYCKYYAKYHPDIDYLKVRIEDTNACKYYFLFSEACMIMALIADFDRDGDKTDRQIKGYIRGLF